MEQLPERLQQEFMQEALFEAKKAKRIGEVPIGCVVVCDGKIIGRGHNLREHANDATMHAEVLAIQEANEMKKSWRLEDCALFVTLEPCPMCAGAIINSRIKQVYFGAFDPKAGACGSLVNLLVDQKFNHQPQVVQSGVLADEAANELRAFFRQIRQKQKELKKQKQNAQNKG